MSARYTRGDTAPIMAPVLTAQAVSVCDLVGLSSGDVVRSADTSWASAVATPSAPTLADGGVSVGGPLTNASTHVEISYQFPWGEGTVSAAAAVTPTAHAVIICSGTPLVPPAPALYTNIYVETSAGSGVYKLWGISYGETVMIGSYGAGQVPYAANPGGTAVLSDATTITQYNFQLTFLGVSGQTKVANTARVFGNGADNLIRVDTAGEYEWDCASTSFNVGQLLGPAKDTGNHLTNQTVSAVVHDTLAVAVCTEATTSSTKVKGAVLSRQVPLALQV